MSLLQTIWSMTAFLALFTALLVVGATDQDIQSHETALYCEMVSIHLEDETLGWPDYRGTYDEVCK